MKQIYEKIVLFVSVFVLFCTVPVFGAPSTDASPWARESVEKAYEMGIVSNELMQKCKKNITRKEFCELAMRFYSLITGESGTTLNPSPFYDEASPYVAKAAELGIVEGTMDGSMFMPNDLLMREQLAELTVKTIQVCDGGKEIDFKNYRSSFYDGNLISESSVQSVHFLAGRKILKGYDGFFFPKGFVTVEQAIFMFMNVYEDLRVDELKVGEIAIKLGESEESVLSKLGTPIRIDTNIYGFERYIFHENYYNLIIVGIKDGEVQELFTNASKFEFAGVVSSMNGYSLSGEKEDDVVDIVNNYRVLAQIGVDSLNNGKIDSIYIRDNRLSVDYDVYKKDLAEDAALELYDLVNAARVRRKAPFLIWDEMAAGTAEWHSREMASDASISYIDANGMNPFERMKEAGIEFSTGAEVISINKNDPIQVYQSWMGSIGSNKNLTDKKLRYCGVGTVISGFRVVATIDLYSK